MSERAARQHVPASSEPMPLRVARIRDRFRSAAQRFIERLTLPDGHYRERYHREEKEDKE